MRQTLVVVGMTATNAILTKDVEYVVPNRDSFTTAAEDRWIEMLGAGRTYWLPAGMPVTVADDGTLSIIDRDEVADQYMLEPGEYQRTR